MSAMRKLFLSLAAAITLGALAAGCESVSDIGSPFGGAKSALLGKAAPTPDLPDRPKLVIPPPNAALPVPGQAVPAQAQWVPSAQQATNDQAANAAPKQDDSSGWFSGLFGSSEKKTQ